LVGVLTCGTAHAFYPTTQPTQKDPISPCPVCPPCCPPKTDSISGKPINYFDGSIILSVEDIPSFSGNLFRHRRTYNNFTTVDYNGPNGYNWFVNECTEANQLSPNYGTIAIQTQPQSSVQFTSTDSGATFTPTFLVANATVSLTHNTTTHQLIYTEADAAGQVNALTFNDYDTSIPTALRGRLLTVTDPWGVTTNATFDTNSNSLTYGLLLNLQRTMGGQLYTMAYVYNTSGANLNLLSSVTLWNGNATTGTIIRQALYTYYDGTGVGGSLNDLKTVVTKDGAGRVIDTYYYRYYTATDHAKGFVHGLKYVFNPQSYARLVTAFGANPESNQSLLDAQLQPYADNYFEYDMTGGWSTRAVVTEIAQGAGCSCSGGSGQGTFSYVRSTNTNAGYTDGVNNWKYKITETLPDNNTNIIYTNYKGQAMLKMLVAGNQQWRRYHKYDSATQQEILFAEPSAVTGFDDTQVNLGVTLAATSGLVHLYDYAQATTANATTPGNVQGYLQDEKVQLGASSTQSLVRSMTYWAQTANNVAAYPLASQTVYRNSDGTGPQTTNYTYTWVGGNTTQMLSKTTTYPAATTTENGPGGTETEIEFYDTYGRLQWSKDAGGYLTYYAHDAITGTVTKVIRDVDTSKPQDFANLPTDSGGQWSTPTGGGLHLITTYQVDPLGRTTMVTDPNSNVTYTVYNDFNHEVRTYPGWDTTAHTTTGPVWLTRTDYPGSYKEALSMAVTPHLTSNLPDGTEAVSNVQTLARSYLDNGNRVINSDQYFDLSGLTYTTTVNLGTQHTPSVPGNFYRTQVGYDVKGRKSKQADALGTITRTVYDALDRVDSVWIGTNDTAATGDWSPTNNSSPANMIQVVQNQYDNGNIGDSNLTQITTYPNATTSRVTANWYDWRNRLVASKSGVQGTEDTTTHRPILYYDLDNLGEIMAVSQFDGDGINALTITAGVPQKPASTTLRKYSVSQFDERGRVCQRLTYSVDQTNGGYTTALVTNTWFDHRGNVVKTSQPGGVVSKASYDGLGRTTVTYLTDGQGDSTWADAGTIGNQNNVLEQTEFTYDANGNIVLTVNKQRLNDETAAGPLSGPTTSPKARVTYSTAYYDALDRTRATAEYGTNNGQAVAAPALPTTTDTLPTPSGTVLVTANAYDPASGYLTSVTDPKALVTQMGYDNLGRVTSRIEAYNSTINNGQPTGANNRTTNYLYDGAGHIVKLTAVMPAGTVSQVTQYVYGVTKATGGSDLYSNSLLAQVQYPDKSNGTASSDPANTNTFTYNALGQITSKTDQNASVHKITYDILGRVFLDAVTTLAGGVDNTVRSVGITYDTGARVYQITNYSDAAGTQIVNQIQKQYNGLGQLTAEYQEHGSAGVNTNTSPQTQYNYNPLTNNNSRLTAVIYPNTSRVVNYLYLEAGDTSGVSDRLSRLTALSTATTRNNNGNTDANVIAGYDYLGGSSVIRINYAQSQTRLDRWGGTSGTYAGLDQFNRISAQQWVQYTPGTGANGANVFLIQHGYDADSNRLYANNQTQPGASQLYQYDTLNRLTTATTGLLGSSNALQSTWTLAQQAWTLDALGNPTGQSTADGANWYQDTFNAQNQMSAATTDPAVQPHKVLASTPRAYTGDTFTNAATASNWTAAAGTFSITPPTMVITPPNGGTGIALLGNAQSPCLVGPLAGWVELTFPTGATGQAGVVFGYTSPGNYWQYVVDATSGNATLYQVVNGTPSIQAGGNVTKNGNTYDLYFSLQAGGIELGGPSGIYSFLAGAPSGQVGLCSTISGVQFNFAKFAPRGRFADMAGHWHNGLFPAPPTYTSVINALDNASTSLRVDASQSPNNDAVLLKQLRLQKFQVTFSTYFDAPATSGDLRFYFNAQDQDNASQLRLFSSGVLYGYAMSHGRPGIWEGWGMMSAWSAGTRAWFRISNDGTTVTAQQILSAATPSDTDWSNTTPFFSSTAFNNTGGLLGIGGWGAAAHMSNLTVRSADGQGNFTITEAVDPLTVDNTGYAADSFTYDNNGNLTYDGLQQYTYDAWNRLSTVAHAYRDSNGAVQAGQVSATYRYDALGRRILKTVNNTGALDGAYHYYYDGQRNIEVRNGSNMVLKQQVWNAGYVDSLAQQGVNSSPTTQTTCDTFYGVCQDANYNVLGLVNASGALAERYEYSPYGQRTVLDSAGANDPGLYAASLVSQRVVIGGLNQPYGLCEFGHQGLIHDDESGLVFNRARTLHPGLGRFMQNDPMGYVDGLSRYTYQRNRSPASLDPGGTTTECEAVPGGTVWLGPWQIYAIVPGEGTVDSIGRGAFFPEALYVRPYVDLFKCCDCTNHPYLKYGQTVLAKGSAESKNNTDMESGMAFSEGISIPLPFGKSGPKVAVTQKLFNFDTTPKFSNAPAEPDPETVRYEPYAQQFPSTGLDVKIVTHIKCDPTGSYGDKPPLPLPVNIDIPSPYIAKMRHL